MTKKKEKINMKDIITDRKFSVFYSMGQESGFFVTHGDDYKLSTLDIQSSHSGEIFAFPVVFVIDEELDTLEIIPINNVSNIKYNWGYLEEAQNFKSQMETITKESKKLKKDKKKLNTLNDIDTKEALHGYV